MRIDGTPRPVKVNARRSAQSTNSGSVFFDLGEEVSTARASSASAPSAATGIDALLALQSVEDPLFAKRKKVKRGLSILEALEDMKVDLLAGKMSEGRLHRLVGLIQQAKEKVDPELDSLLEDIELRALVELAKFGFYPKN